MSTSGKYLTVYVTAGGPGAPPEDGTWTGGGGGAGVWMSGTAIASDNSGRLFFATGNGGGTRVNNQAPASGRVHLDTLSESMVNLAVNPRNGSLTQGDYFEPYGYLFFSSLWPYKNPFALLKDNAFYLKELAGEPLDSYEWQ